MSQRIVYQLVAPMDLTAGPAEVARRQQFLQDRAGPGIGIEVRPTRHGRAAIESEYDAMLAAPEILHGVETAVADGAAAAIVGCFSDPALDALREAVDVPVIGPGEAAMCLALQLGHRFSVISPLASGAGRRDAHVRGLGLSARYASCRGIGVSVADMAGGSSDPFAGILAAGRACIEEDGADVLILGCMSMAFLDQTARIESELGVPVINPVIAALKTAEMCLAHRLRPSRRSWAKPAEKTTFHHNRETA